ncbi:MAG: XdhC/CoxI family protein, partial [Clostridia bacterium]|nr:XdhC/CoxI family protein [Clostridia bacterium]
METLFRSVRDALKAGKDLVLCSIIASSGSTPRGSGAKMAVFADGSTKGTIGGGAVEFESIKLAKQALQRRAAFFHGFNLAPNQTADIGMICGGQVEVYFQFFSSEDPEAVAMFDCIVDLYNKQENTWLVTKIQEDGVQKMGVFSPKDGLLFAEGIPQADILPLVKARAVLQEGNPTYYVEPLTRSEIVYVFGGGHVSQELVPILSHVGFAVAVFEDRPAFADPALFPTAIKTIEGNFQDISAKVTITSHDYVVIMTRGHQADFVVLSQALRTKASYIGVIGSRNKIAATHRRLLEAGIPEAELSRIHAPIGLPIQAETPAEIAISIAGQLILH